MIQIINIVCTHIQNIFMTVQPLEATLVHSAVCNPVCNPITATAVPSFEEAIESRRYSNDTLLGPADDDVSRGRVTQGMSIVLLLILLVIVIIVSST